MLDRRNEPDPAVWLSDSSCSLEEFRAHVEQRTDPSDCRHAADIVSNIPVYDGVQIAKDLKDDADWLPVMAEWNRVWAKGPGIVLVRRGLADIGLLDAVTDKLNEIIHEEAIGNGGKGDHFAAAGANSRVWNSHEKLCMKSPELFARYNANEFTRRLSEAWLGSGYQITAQANVVRPGGKAQIAHRDYHMGFQSEKSLLGYPATQHALSTHLTLQGAVAHTDMPVSPVQPSCCLTRKAISRDIWRSCVPNFAPISKKTSFSLRCKKETWSSSTRRSSMRRERTGRPTFTGLPI